MLRPIGMMVLWAAIVGGQAQAPAQTVPTAEQPQVGTGKVGVGPGGYTLQVNTQRVVLDVVVKDKYGALVKGLGKDDFTVYEDKVPQEVRSFEETAPERAGARVAIHSTAELDRLEPDAAVSIIVIDELTTTFEDIAFARYSLMKYLKAQGDTLEQPTMLVAANFENVSVLRDYTTSKEAILGALDRHQANYGPLGRVGSMTYQNDLVNATFRSLIGVAESAAGHPGHKNMIWIGRGFPTVFMNLMQPDDKEAFKTELANCTRLLRDSRITLYTLSSSGVSAFEPASDDASFFFVGNPFADQVDFDKIALSTGGAAMHGRNDLNKMIGESVQSGESFYTLAYRPSSMSQDAKEFRNIKVVMKDRELRASTREGYFVAPAPVIPLLAQDGKYSKRVVFDFNVASSNVLDYDGVNMTVTRDEARPDAFQLHVRATDLALQADAAQKQSAELTIAVVSFDRKGNLLGHNVRLVTAQIEGDAMSGGLGARTISIPVSIATQVPAARVRFVLRANGNGRMGAANYFLVARRRCRTRR
jgi:VWFA-related protein